MNANEKASKDLAIRYETELANTETGLLIVKMVDGEDGVEKNLDYYFGAERSLLKVMSLLNGSKKDSQTTGLVASMLSYVEHRILVLHGEWK